MGKDPASCAGEDGAAEPTRWAQSGSDGSQGSPSSLPELLRVNFNSNYLLSCMLFQAAKPTAASTLPPGAHSLLSLNLLTFHGGEEDQRESEFATAGLALALGKKPKEMPVLN